MRARWLLGAGSGLVTSEATVIQTPTQDQDKPPLQHGKDDLKQRAQRQSSRTCAQQTAHVINRLFACQEGSTLGCLTHLAEQRVERVLWKFLTKREWMVDVPASSS